MVTLLDCIRRFADISDGLIDRREETFRPLLETIRNSGKKINQIILCGSGSSFNEIITAKSFVEKTSGLQTISVYPNDLLYSTSVYNTDALYVFVSQSGTSTLTQQAAVLVKEKGALTAALTSFETNPLVAKTDAYIEQGVGKEEYGFVTVGFDCGVLTLMLMGLELGRYLGNLSEEEYARQIEDAHKISPSHREVTDKAMKWFDLNKEQLLRTSTFTIYGGGSLYGIALESALKILEVAKRNISVGYEIDDGMHGPTMGFTPSNCIIGLNDGGHNEDKQNSLIRWGKEKKNNGFIIGVNPINDRDLGFEPVSGDWKGLEYAPAIQVLAYRLAVDMGVDLLDKSRHTERAYFATHDKKAE